VSLPEPPLAALGMRSIGAIAEMPANLTGARAYHAERFRLGVPEGSDFGTEKIFALDAGLDELNAVSFTKGCYVGQELTSRMKHRATARKRILSVTGQLPAPGAAIRRGDVEIGELLSSYGTHGFALVRLDRLEESTGDIAAGEIPVALTRPAWLASPDGE
jgi:folate-binding protein YgfZ